MPKPSERTLQLIAMLIAGQVENPRETLYVAALVRNVPSLELPYVECSCTNCGRTTAIDTTMLHLAENSAGVICDECIQEITGKSLGEIIHDQLANLTKDQPNA